MRRESCLMGVNRMGKTLKRRLSAPDSLSKRALSCRFLRAMRSPPLTASGVRFKLAAYVKAAAETVPSLQTKHITPHSFRHYVPFLTMSCNVRRASDLPGNCRSHRDRPHSITRHSLPSATGCSESQEGDRWNDSGGACCAMAKPSTKHAASRTSRWIDLRAYT